MPAVPAKYLIQSGELTADTFRAACQVERDKEKHYVPTSSQNSYVSQLAGVVNRLRGDPGLKQLNGMIGFVCRGGACRSQVPPQTNDMRC